MFSFLSLVKYEIFIQFSSRQEKSHNNHILTPASPVIEFYMFSLSCFSSNSTLETETITGAECLICTTGYSIIMFKFPHKSKLFRCKFSRWTGIQRSWSMHSRSPGWHLLLCVFDTSSTWCSKIWALSTCPGLSHSLLSVNLH